MRKAHDLCLDIARFIGVCKASEVREFECSGRSRHLIRVVPSSQDPNILKNEGLSGQGSSTVKCSVYVTIYGFQNFKEIL